MQSKRAIRSSAALAVLVSLGAIACGSGAAPQAKVGVSPRRAPSERRLEAIKTSSMVRPSIPRCRAHQLSARFLGTGIGLGHAGVFVGFTNTSSTKCSLRGRPVVTLMTAGGETLPLRQKGGTYINDSDDNERVVLAPGLRLRTDRAELKRGQALLVFEWMACRPQPKIGRIGVSVRRGGAEMSVPVGPRGIPTSGEPMCWPGQRPQPWLAVGTFENVPY
jgi:hypothetical protein